MKLPEMCNTCKELMVLKICKDYKVGLAYERHPSTMEKQPNGDYILTTSYTIRPDFSKWDGHTGID